MSDREAVPPPAVAPPARPVDSAGRIALLDVLRLLAIIEIIGFHWLRTCQQNGIFGLVWKPGYEDVQLGLAQLSYLITDQSGFSPGALVNNAIGLLFGFGWEAVDAFVLISGLSLALNYRPDRPGFAPTKWRLRRLGRILLPYYGVAFLLICTAEFFRAAAGHDAGVLGQMAAKLAGKNLADPLPIIALKHLFLVDPRQDLWIADMFSPAWWFIPPLLVAYMAFPTMFRAVRWLGPTDALALSLLVSVTAYFLNDAGILPQHGWYYIILYECFDFTLGIVVGRAMTDPDFRSRLLQFVGSPGGLACGLFLFAAGNLANWERLTYPAASALFTPGLTLVMAYLAALLSRSARAVAAARRVDGYYIYLLHQFPAFPLSVLAAALGTYWAREVGFGLGFAVYLMSVVFIVLAFDRVVRQLGRFWSRAVPGRLSDAAPPAPQRPREALDGTL